MIFKRPDKCTPAWEDRCCIPMVIDGEACEVDYCISDIVAALNDAGIITLNSCCGHGGTHGNYIMLKDNRMLTIGNVLRDKPYKWWMPKDSGFEQCKDVPLEAGRVDWKDGT